MPERRRVVRREPIIIETDNGEFEAHPLPWQQRNDLGDLLIQTYVASVSAMVGAIRMDAETGQVAGGHLDDKVFDWAGLLALGFPSVESREFDKLDIFEMRELVKASLEINDLDHLSFMIDPNSRSQSSAEEAEEATSDGPKIMSTPDSGSADSQEVRSNSSPTQS